MKTSARGIVDIAAKVAPLDRYIFVANSATSTVNGMFVNEYGTRTGNRFTASVATNAASAFTQIYGATIPSDAVGAVIDASQDLVYDIVPESTDIEAAKTLLASEVAKAPTILAGSNISVGRVA